MKLKYITTDKCPVCGTGIIIKEEAYTTEFGQFNTVDLNDRERKYEHRTFACGQKVSYIPNFERVELSKHYVCTNNEKYKDADRKRDAADSNVKMYIEQLDVDEDYKRC